MSKLRMVLLDAGHGGIVNGKYVTAGKRSPVWKDGIQYFEGVGNREIRDRLARMLREEGISFKFVNEGNEDIPLSKRTTFINKVAREYGVSETLVISIHSNGFTKESAHGWSCYTSKGQTLADQYAENLYHEMMKEFPSEKFRMDKTDGDMDIEENFWILQRTVCPAILSENFFHTNERECKEILMTEQGQERIAKAHFNMIKSYFRCDRK